VDFNGAVRVSIAVW